MFLLWRYAWNPSAPTPIDRSIIAEYLARLITLLALSIKYCKTLSKHFANIANKRGSSFQSSYFSIFGEDRSHTAVLSLLVGCSISVHRSDCLTNNPLSLKNLGNALFVVSMKCIYGSPVCIRNSTIFSQRYLALTVF